MWVRAKWLEWRLRFPKLSDVDVVNHSDKPPQHDFTDLGNRHPEIIKSFSVAGNSIAMPTTNDDPAAPADGAAGKPLAAPPAAALDFFAGTVSWHWALQLVSRSGGAT